MTRADRQDRFAIRFGVCCVVFATVVQYRQHALWFQLKDPYAASSTREVPSSTKGETYARVRSHSDGSVPARHTSSTERYQLRADADALVSTTVHPRRLVSLRAHHSPARRGMELGDRQRLLGRNAVHPVHVGVCRWSWACVAGVAEGAVVAGVPGVGPRRGEAR